MSYETISGLTVGSHADSVDGNFDASDDPVDVTVFNSPMAGTFVGSNFNFESKDAMVDNVSGISLSGDLVGSNEAFLVTNEDDEILAIAADMTGLEAVNFDIFESGRYAITYVRYEWIEGLVSGFNLAGVEGLFAYSDNSIFVDITSAVEAGTLVGGLFHL